MATTVLGLKTFTASDPVDYNEINDNYNKIDSGVKTALQGRAAHNLLDNSDFSNLVNQDNLSGTLTSAGYIFDRWSLVSGSVAIGDSGITLDGTIKQVLEAAPSGSVTAAASAGAASYDAGTKTFTLTASGVMITWAALYEGSYTADTLPAYQPKGYAAELAECQRYYYQSWTGSIGANGIITRQAMALPRLASVELPCTMRTTPTITLYTSNGQAGAVKGWLDSVVVSGMTVVYANSKSFIPAHEGNGLTIGNWYGFHYTASADL